jgi:hypothetical protein
MRGRWAEACEQAISEMRRLLRCSAGETLLHRSTAILRRNIEEARRSTTPEKPRNLDPNRSRPTSQVRERFEGELFAGEIKAFASANEHSNAKRRSAPPI